MANPVAFPMKIALFEGRGAQPFTAEERYDLVQGLLERGYAMEVPGPQSDPPREGEGVAVFLGKLKTSRAPKNQALEGKRPVRVEDITGRSLDQVAQRLDAIRAEAGNPRPGAWKPWFPVIDYERCTNCMQCLSFCLFGVYGVGEIQQIQVQNPDQCKTNCPACSRVCPEAAIIFPKYASGPINGDAVNEHDLNREKMKVDISSLLGGDVYQMLRARSERAQSRFSKERDSAKALQERQKCLAKLRELADIPPEVLMSLPSPEEIQRRAAEAAEKAKKALEQNVQATVLSEQENDQSSPV